MGWGVIFDGWQSIGRTAFVGILAYVCLVIVLRISGKRTLSKMNAFDLVVTVALGSILGTILLSKDVSLAAGVTGLTVLVGMQYVVAWLSVRSQSVHNAVRSEPRLLLRNGKLLHDAMKQERVSQSDIAAAVRNSGASSMEAVDAVILETDGSFSVIQSSAAR